MNNEQRIMEAVRQQLDLGDPQPSEAQLLNIIRAVGEVAQRRAPTASDWRAAVERHHSVAEGHDAVVGIDVSDLNDLLKNLGGESTSTDRT
jgi:hypothetical protein